MSTIDRAALENVIQSSQSRIKVPAYFEICVGRWRFFLLGSNHIVPLEHFSPDVLRNIGECSSVISEEEEVSVEEIRRFRDSFVNDFSREDGDIDWYGQFSSDEQRIAKSYFEAFLKALFVKNAPVIEARDMKLQIVSWAIDSCLRPIVANELFEKEKVVGIDIKLLSLFHDNETGLETSMANLHRKIKQEISVSDVIKDIKVAFAYEKGELMHEIAVQMQECDYDPRRFEQGGHLTDFRYTWNLEREDAEKNCYELAQTNRSWCYKMLRLMQQKTDVILFVVGVDHLIGTRGILNLLAIFGARIRQIDAHGKFHDFRYMYPEFEKLLRGSRHGWSLNRRAMVFDFKERLRLDPSFCELVVTGHRDKKTHRRSITS